MNDTKTNSRLNPRSVVVIYHDKNKVNFYLEHREIRPADGKLMLMAPVPLAEDVMKNVALSYMKTNLAEMTHDSIIGSHILYAMNQPGHTVVMWYRPAMKRFLNFSSHLKITSDEAWVPATLYLVINKTIYLFALMTDERPNAQTKLYNAPFFNIYDDGNVCMGSAVVGKQKGKTYEKEAERWERAFYMAEQTGMNNETTCKTDLKKLWPQLIKAKTVFPSKKELNQHRKHKTLGDLINRLIRKTNFSHEEA